MIDDDKDGVGDDILCASRLMASVYEEREAYVKFLRAHSILGPDLTFISGDTSKCLGCLYLAPELEGEHGKILRLFEEQMVNFCQELKIMTGEAE